MDAVDAVDAVDAGRCDIAGAGVWGAWSTGDQPFYDAFLSEMAPFETIRFHQFH